MTSVMRGMRKVSFSLTWDTYPRLRLSLRRIAELRNGRQLKLPRNSREIAEAISIDSESLPQPVAGLRVSSADIFLFYLTGSCRTIEPIPVDNSPSPSILQPSGTFVTLTFISSGLSLNTPTVPSSPVT